MWEFQFGNVKSQVGGRVQAAVCEHHINLLEGCYLLCIGNLYLFIYFCFNLTVISFWFVLCLFLLLTIELGWSPVLK